MIPHTIVLKPELVVHKIYNGYWFWGRPSVYDLWRDLREVSSEMRPDWDLSRPGLAEAWDTGDLSPFHGWNKRDPEKLAQLMADRERLAEMVRDRRRASERLGDAMPDVMERP
jgi:hypothetical protein